LSVAVRADVAEQDRVAVDVVGVEPVQVDGRRCADPQDAVRRRQIGRNVMFAYSTANPSFFRAVIDRLEPGEKVRNVTTNHGTYEYSREEFRTRLPDAARTDSYLTSTASAHAACRYVTGSPSEGSPLKELLAPD
jgi:hypothetical protein